jgi:predicted cation transporter
MMPAQSVYWLLGGIVLLVLLLPLRWRRVERNIEVFLLVMGALATTIASLWSWGLLAESLQTPWLISTVVLAVGLGFHLLRRRFDRSFKGLQSRVPPRALAFLIAASLGLP